MRWSKSQYSLGATGTRQYSRGEAHNPTSAGRAKASRQTHMSFHRSHSFSATPVTAMSNSETTAASAAACFHRGQDSVSSQLTKATVQCYRYDALNVMIISKAIPTMRVGW